MRVPIEPTVYVLMRPTLDEDALVSFLASRELEWARTDNATPAEEIVEIAGRVCYMSFGTRQSPRSNREYIENLVQRGHGSVLEHIVWTFALSGVSRAFTHQLVRHRVGFAFSQTSQQYLDHREARVVVPSAIDSDEALRAVWDEAIDTAFAAYDALLSELDPAFGPVTEKREKLRGARSAARSVLPQATEAPIVVSANARALRHFFAVRGAVEGDEEMRKVAALILTEVSADAPAAFSDFYIEMLDDQLPIVRQESSPRT